MGLFEQAEAVLQEALALREDGEESSAVSGNNLALLGKLYLEWQRIPDAIEPLLAGWKITQAAWQVSVVPIVRNYYVELLMHPEYKGRDLAESDRLLRTTLAEIQVSGFHRSAIAALSIRSRLALMQDQIEAALDDSTQAVTYLERIGTMPALRTEEVLYYHYCVLQRAGRAIEALDYLKRAHTVLQKKAETISNQEYRRSFLERVPVSRAILSALNAL